MPELTSSDRCTLAMQGAKAKPAAKAVPKPAPKYAAKFPFSANCMYPT